MTTNNKTVKLSPLQVTLLDDDRKPVRTITVYEASRRVNRGNLPSGWHRYAWRDNGGSGANDTFERYVLVNHLNDYISREDVNALLDQYGGMYFSMEYLSTQRHPLLEMPDDIYL
jgi:hypothetical protein